jgi:transposase
MSKTGAPLSMWKSSSVTVLSLRWCIFPWSRDDFFMRFYVSLKIRPRPMKWQKPELLTLKPWTQLFKTTKSTLSLTLSLNSTITLSPSVIPRLHYLLQLFHDYIISFSYSTITLSPSVIPRLHYLLQLFHDYIISFSYSTITLSPLVIPRLHYLLQLFHDYIISFSYSTITLSPSVIPRLHYLLQCPSVIPRLHYLLQLFHDYIISFSYSTRRMEFNNNMQFWTTGPMVTLHRLPMLNTASILRFHLWIDPCMKSPGFLAPPSLMRLF